VKSREEEAEKVRFERDRFAPRSFRSYQKCPLVLLTTNSVLISRGHLSAQSDAKCIEMKKEAFF